MNLSKQQQRVQSLLMQLAQQLDAKLIPSDWAEQGSYTERVTRLAGRLADRGLLVLVARVAGSTVTEAEQDIQTWINNYVRFYTLMADALLPSYRVVRSGHTDHQLPAIMTIYGQSPNIIRVLGGCVAPYIADRYGQPLVEEVGLRGLVDIVLEELAAEDLSGKERNRVMAEGITILRDMRNAPVQQLHLTPYIRDFITATQPIKVIPDEAEGQPDKPMSLPETGPLALKQATPAPKSDPPAAPQGGTGRIEGRPDSDDGSRQEPPRPRSPFPGWREAGEDDSQPL